MSAYLETRRSVKAELRSPNHKSFPVFEGALNCYEADMKHLFCEDGETVVKNKQIGSRLINLIIPCSTPLPEDYLFFLTPPFF